MARVPIDDEIDLADEANPFAMDAGADVYEQPKTGDTELDLGFRAGAGRLWFGIALAGAIGGIFFSGRSTADFVVHLDRQVHAIHCSVGVSAPAELGESGCRTAMMSPYSSWFREDYWGGIPVSLWALAVFAFLAYRAGHLLWRGRARRGEALFLLAATGLPVGMSVIYGWIAYRELGAACQVCIGMYVSSAVAFAGALVGWLTAARPPPDALGAGAAAAKGFAIGVGEGCAFVAALTFVYLIYMPHSDANSGRGVAGCGTLVQPEDTAGVMFDLARTQGGTPAIELLDPLCPACRVFDERLAASSLASKLDLRAVPFPLDSTCNWMVTQSLHPGACAVTEAMLCDPGGAREVLRWAFANQAPLIERAKSDEAGVRAEIEAKFPRVKGCLGTAVARNKVVKSLRWAVANALPVMTPQLFVRGTRLCDEDTDLGLEYTLSRMLAGAKP